MGVACAIFTARRGCRIKFLRIHLKISKFSNLELFLIYLSLFANWFAPTTVCPCFPTVGPGQFEPGSATLQGIMVDRKSIIEVWAVVRGFSRGLWIRCHIY